MGRVSRQWAHVVTAMVTSKVNSSPRAPAVALPSSGVVSTSASRWSESFGPDPCRFVAELDEGVGHRLDEGGGPTDVAVRLHRRGPSQLGEQFGVDPAAVTGPVRRRLTRQGEGDGPMRAGQRLEPLSVDD